jgi:DNA recombination protein RmuC
MSLLVYLLAGLATGLILGWFFGRKEAAAATNALQTAEVEKRVLQEKVDAARHQQTHLEAQNQAAADKMLQLSTELSAALTIQEQLRQQLGAQDEHLREMLEKMQLQFRSMASSILEDKSKQFTEHNKSQLDQLLQPLRDRLRDFEQTVQSTHKESIEKQAGLFNELRNLKELNRQMSEEARSLTRALKGETKTQGNWGEVVLQRILERSGLTLNQEYRLQESVVSEDGRRLQPDVTILLPDNKYMVIDSKVSLVDYERMANAEDPAEQAAALKRHLQSIRNHVRDLSSKNYQQLYGPGSPDFVLLFVPIEPAFMAAVQNDADLFSDAFDRNIVIVSTSTLLATLRTIASLWRQENQNKNAQEIARQAGSLYDKFTAFAEDLVKVGQQLDATDKTYKLAMNKLVDGKDNLVRKAERLRELGAKNARNLDPRLLDRADEQ